MLGVVGTTLRTSWQRYHKAIESQPETVTSFQIFTVHY
jgi:hypothetical protein